MGTEASSGLTAVLEAIESQRQEARETAMATIRGAESERDDLLRRLDQAVAALEGKSTRSIVPSLASAPSPARPRRRRAKSKRSVAAVHKRCEAVARFLSEQADPAPQRTICGALKISPAEARTALTRLEAEGKVVRTGTGSTTCYKLKGGSSAALRSVPLGLASGEQGTLQGRILMLLQDRGSASLDELVQALGVARERVLKECGALIRQEEVQMGRRDGRPIYLCQVAA
jgi:hypothetical protein